jgi:hypothetical protein
MLNKNDDVFNHKLCKLNQYLSQISHKLSRYFIMTMLFQLSGYAAVTASNSASLIKKS